MRSVAAATSVAVGLLGIFFLSVAHAEPDVSARTRWGFYFNLGAGDQSGDFADQLEKGTTGEFGIVRQEGAWRYGLGLSFGSWGMVPPYDNELEWGFQRIDLMATRVFKPESSLRPYLQGRVGIVRLHPRSELFKMDPLPDDFAVGDSPTDASNGMHIGVVPGLELDLNGQVALDLSVLLDYYIVQGTDLRAIGGPADAQSGFDWQARVGVLWWNDGGPGSTPAEPDAWGVRPSYGWALGEALAINFGASAFNEYVRNANFNQISPRSWWSNLEEGFTYDDNEFKTNQFIHPFNGSQYYNAARSNGLGFWPSYGIAMIGAFHWELAGETHPMSFNDLIATGVGGAAMGEAMYRFSSMMLDNEATGAGRFFREAGGFVVDPIRGLNRVISGRAWKVRPNPSDPMDTNPVGQLNRLSVGYRETARGAWPSLEHDTDDYAFLEYWHVHGDVFDNSRRGPFDYFTFNGEMSVGDKTRLDRLFIEGNWLTVPVAREDDPNHMAAISQHFEYANSNAYEYGGQSIGPSFFSVYGKNSAFSVSTRFDVMATLMGAVNSDYSDSLAVVADQERAREYDYGPGFGGKARVMLSHRGEPFLSARYELHFLYVTNGSIYHGGDEEIGNEVGLDARHWLHGANVRLDLPPVRRIGLGAEYRSFTRESHYKITFPEEPALTDFSITQLVKQTNPELKIYLTYCPDRD